jgi:hypothetical protein
MLDSGAWIPARTRAVNRRISGRLIAAGNRRADARPPASSVGVTLAGRTRVVSQPNFRQQTFGTAPFAARELTRGRSGPPSMAPSWDWRETGAVPRQQPRAPQSGSIGIEDAGIFAVSPSGELAVALGCRRETGASASATLGQVPIRRRIAARARERPCRLPISVPTDRTWRSCRSPAASTGSSIPLGKVLVRARWDGLRTPVVSPRGDRIAFLDHAQLGDISGSVAVYRSGRQENGSFGRLESCCRASHGLRVEDEVWFTGSSRNGKGGSSALYAATMDGRERTVFASPGNG